MVFQRSLEQLLLALIPLSSLSVEEAEGSLEKRLIGRQQNAQKF